MLGSPQPKKDAQGKRGEDGRLGDGRGSHIQEMEPDPSTAKWVCHTDTWLHFIHCPGMGSGHLCSGLRSPCAVWLRGCACTLWVLISLEIGQDDVRD